VRYCFLLHVRPELLDEYKERHTAVWPDMLRALKLAGWERYSLFAKPDGLIVGYTEAEDLEAAQHAMAATDANTRWQSEMRRYFVSIDGQAPGGTMVLLEPIFNLDDQLAALDARDPAPLGEGAHHS
jgi:L-rhamnose mutarotase